METKVKVLADSCHRFSNARLTTLEVTFPRFILAEVNTHRVLSRNFRSSRAVPVAKLIEEVRTSPFVPASIGKNKSGMQALESLDELSASAARTEWRMAAATAAQYAENLSKLGVHKQLANRVMEPYLYVHGVISATDWENFFKLRCHPDAQPEFQHLANLIRGAIQSSTPRQLDEDQWHLPYVSEVEKDWMPIEQLLKLSAARCAWVSYKPFDESADSDIDKANRTFQRLVMSEPMHASPCEHQATPGPRFKSNYRDWDQLRHFLEADADFRRFFE